MAGNLENVGYASLDIKKAGIYNILMMEEKQDTSLNSFNLDALLIASAWTVRLSGFNFLISSIVYLIYSIIKNLLWKQGVQTVLPERN